MLESLERQFFIRHQAGVSFSYNFFRDSVNIYDLIIVKKIGYIYIYICIGNKKKKEKERKERHSLLFICSSENFNKTASRRPGQGIP